MASLFPFGPCTHLSTPLLLIGLAALGFQVMARPNALDLFKALIVSTAFLLWGIDQLLPTGWLATTVGDMVIVMYVIDLGWMMVDHLRQQEHGEPAPQEQTLSSLQLPSSSESPTQPLHILPLPPSSSRTWQGEQPSPLLSGHRQPTRSSSALKRHRLLPVAKPPNGE